MGDARKPRPDGSIPFRGAESHPEAMTLSAITPAPGTLRSVRHALAVLAILAEADEPVRVTEVAERLGVAPSTAHRLLATLVAAGYAMRSATSHRYRRGPALVRLGSRPIGSPMRLQQLAHPILARLAVTSDRSAHLAVLDGLDVVAVDHVDAPRPLHDHADGVRLPAHATALGQAILAFAPEAVEALEANGLTRLTAHTVADPAAFRRILRDVRRRGYAVNIGGWKPGTAGVAAAIRDARGEAVAAIGLTGPSSGFTGRPALQRLGAITLEAAVELTVQLEGQRPPHHG